MNSIEAFFIIRIAATTPSYIFGDRRLSGKLQLSEETRTALQTIDAAGDLLDLRVAGRRSPASSLPATGEAEFLARAPTSYFETLDELIERHPQSPPSGFKVFHIIDDDEKTPLYLQAIKLAQLLSSLAASSNHKGCTLFANDALEIPFSYSKSDLRIVDGLDEICGLMATSDSLTPEAARMLDVYRSLFKQALSDVLSPLPKDKRFATLLANFPECRFRFRLSFRRFSDEANSAIERYEQTRAGMISALNAVLGNIQTSLIGVPLAGLLALKEMKASQGFTFENIIIASAVVIVGTLLMALSFSQGKTLQSIKDQHGELAKEIEDSGGGQTKISKALVSMDNHHGFISKLLVAVRVVIGIFVLIAIGVLFVR